MTCFQSWKKNSEVCDGLLFHIFMYWMWVDCSQYLLYCYTPYSHPYPPKLGGWVAYWNHGVHALSVQILSGASISASQSFATKLGMVVHHHEPECYARTLALLSHGPCVKDSYFCNQNVTISTISFELLILLQPDLISINLIYPIKRWCVQGQGHSNGSKFILMFGWYLLNCQYYYQNWFSDPSSCKIVLLSSGSRS